MGTFYIICKYLQLRFGVGGRLAANQYILIGLSDGTIQLNEFVEGLSLMKFEKFGLGN